MSSTTLYNQEEIVRAAEVQDKLRANDPFFHKLALNELPHHYVMDAVGKLPALEELTVQFGGTVMPASVVTRALKSASKLKILKLGKLRFASQCDFSEFIVALKSCTSLQEVSLVAVRLMVQGSNRVTPEGKIWFEETESSKQSVGLDPLFQAMASLPNLKYIQLQQNLNDGRIQSPSHESLRLLCQSPRDSLVLRSCQLSEEQCHVIANELQNHTSELSTLVVTGNSQLNLKAWDAFIAMLSINYNIVRFDPDEEGERSAPSTEQLTKIRYYLKLNQNGRKELLCGPAASRRRAWFDFLVKSTNDLDLVFYSLIADPSNYCT